MFGNLLTGWHVIIILAVVVLLFGATKLPALSKSVGQSIRIFRREMKTMNEEKAGTEAATSDAVDSALRTPAQPTEP